MSIFPTPLHEPKPKILRSDGSHPNLLDRHNFDKRSMWRNHISRNGKVLNMENSDFSSWLLDMCSRDSCHIQEENFEAFSINSLVD